MNFTNSIDVEKISNIYIFYDLQHLKRIFYFLNQSENHRGEKLIIVF